MEADEAAGFRVSVPSAHQSQDLLAPSRRLSEVGRRWFFVVVAAAWHATLSGTGHATSELLACVWSGDLRISLLAQHVGSLGYLHNLPDGMYNGFGFY